MKYRQPYLAQAIICAFAGVALPALSQDNTKSLGAVTVTGDALGSSANAMILTPSKVLSGDELRDKLGGSIGETLNNELGVSASGFSSGASRPIIRGLDGPRIKILQKLSRLSSESTGKLPLRQLPSTRRYITATAAYDQSIDTFPSIIVGPNKSIVPLGSFAEAQAQVSLSYHHQRL
jgi:hypothetical protein